jgi:hypothetical protein
MTATEPTRFAGQAPAHFRADLEKLTVALEPWIFVDPTDGWRGVWPTAPDDLVRPYMALVSAGYAQGWFA